MIRALKQLLWSKGVPAVTVWSNLEVLPVAQGWKRGLIVRVGEDETACVCHSDGHVLPYTYHSVPVGYGRLLGAPKGLGGDGDDGESKENEEKKENQLRMAWTPDM